MAFVPVTPQKQGNWGPGLRLSVSWLVGAPERHLLALTNTQDSAWTAVGATTLWPQTSASCQDCPGNHISQTPRMTSRWMSTHLPASYTQGPGQENSCEVALGALTGSGRSCLAQDITDTRSLGRSSRWMWGVGHSVLGRGRGTLVSWSKQVLGGGVRG
jgi:hypothetical protein